MTSAWSGPCHRRPADEIDGLRRPGPATGRPDLGRPRPARAAGVDRAAHVGGARPARPAAGHESAEVLGELDQLHEEYAAYYLEAEVVSRSTVIAARARRRRQPHEPDAGRRSPDGPPSARSPTARPDGCRRGCGALVPAGARAKVRDRMAGGGQRDMSFLRRRRATGRSDRVAERGGAGVRRGGLPRRLPGQHPRPVAHGAGGGRRRRRLDRRHRRARRPDRRTATRGCASCTRPTPASAPRATPAPGHATGEYLAFADSDDLVVDGRLRAAGRRPGAQRLRPRRSARWSGFDGDRRFMTPLMRENHEQTAYGVTARRGAADAGRRLRVEQGVSAGRSGTTHDLSFPTDVRYEDQPTLTRALTGRRRASTCWRTRSTCGGCAPTAPRSASSGPTRGTWPTGS